MTGSVDQEEENCGSLEPGMERQGEAMAREGHLQ